MNTLYWITVLGNLHNVAKGICVFAIISMIVTGTFISVAALSDEEHLPLMKKAFKMSAVGLIIGGLVVLFAPNTTQLYAIYGIGTVLNYAKDSKEMQKLPDTAIKALNKYLEYKED